MSERRQLINLAYRLLGSLAEAEDAVRETYAYRQGRVTLTADGEVAPRALSRSLLEVSAPVRDRSLPDSA